MTNEINITLSSPNQVSLNIETPTLIMPVITTTDDTLDIAREGINYTIKQKTYTHMQGVASNEWNIQHNLDRYPSVTVVDTANNVVIGEVRYVDANNVVLHFNGSFKGKAYLN